MTINTELLQDEALGSKLIKKGSRGYLFMILMAPVGYIIKVLVSNTLSVEDVGIFYSVLGFIILLSAYNDLGLTEALMYFLPKYWIEKKYNEFKTIWYVTLGAQLISGTLISLGLYFGAERLAIHHFQAPEAANIVRTLCRYFIGVNFLQVFSACYTAFQDIIAANIQELIKMYTTLIFTLIFRTTHTLTKETFSLARIFGIALGVLVGGFFFIKKYRHTLQKGTFIPSASLLKTQMKYAFWVFLGANVGTLFSQVDQQLVINFLGPKAAGYYNNFFTLLGTYSVVTGPLLGLLFPISTELIAKNSTEKLKLLQNILYKYFSVFALSIGGLFLALGPVVACVFFGTKFLPSGDLLRRIGPALIFNVLIGINYSILAGRGLVKERVKILGRALLANIILNAVTILGLGRGLYGAIIALTGGRIMLRRLSYKHIHKHQPISFSRGYLGRNTLVIGIMTSILRYISAHLFILDDTYRYQNLARLAGLTLLYYILLATANYKSIQTLIGEIKNIRK